MLLTPRYDQPAVLEVHADLGDLTVPLVRQRERLATALGGLDDAAWQAPSRCEGWSVQDVAAHLIGTNEFWTISLASGVAGQPTRFLTTFDPVATPPQMVEPMRTMAAAEVLERLVASSTALADVVRALDDDGWSALAESPLGHVTVDAVVLHALWDAWVHERDILLPLGVEPAVEHDEVTGSLLYVAALGPAFLAARGGTRPGRLAFAGTEPDVHVVVEHGTTARATLGAAPAGTPTITGPSVELVDALSFRAPLAHGLGDDDVWMLGGLAETFDVAV